MLTHWEASKGWDEQREEEMGDSLSLPIPVPFPRCLRKSVPEPWCLFPGRFALFANPSYQTKAKGMRSATWGEPTPREPRVTGSLLGQGQLLWVSLKGSTAPGTSLGPAGIVLAHTQCCCEGSSGSLWTHGQLSGGSFWSKRKENTKGFACHSVKGTKEQSALLLEVNQVQRNIPDLAGTSLNN